MSDAASERSERATGAERGTGPPRASVWGSPRGEAPRVNMRRSLLWLIGGRAAVITLLLGSASLILYRTPDALTPDEFPVAPFFAMIGLTYGLTVVWTLTLRFVD